MLTSNLYFFMQANFGHTSWFCKFTLWAVSSSSIVRGMANIVKPSKSYRLTLQWMTLVITKSKCSLYCGSISAAATICDGTYKTFLICSDSKQNKKKRYYCSLFVPIVWSARPTNKKLELWSNMERWSSLQIQEQIILCTLWRWLPSDAKIHLLGNFLLFLMEREQQMQLLENPNH